MNTTRNAICTGLVVVALHASLQTTRAQCLGGYDQCLTDCGAGADGACDGVCGAAQEACQGLCETVNACLVGCAVDCCFGFCPNSAECQACAANCQNAYDNCIGACALDCSGCVDCVGVCQAIYCSDLCGGEGQPGCPCSTGLCCDSGLGLDPPSIGVTCSACAAVNPGYFCDLDGYGQEGEPPWAPGTVEMLRTGLLCDRGLDANLFTNECVNSATAKRHKPDVDAFEQTWAARALTLQRRLNDYLPITQGQYLSAHNSFATSVDLTVLYEHSYSMSDQLDMGLRSIGLDAHWSNAAYPGGDFKDVRLSHAQNDHTGMTPLDRPYRHGIEELAIWIDARPGELVMISIENRTEDHGADLIPPLEDYLSALLFRPSDYEVFGAWHTVRPIDILNLGKRVVVFTETGNLPEDQDTIHADLPRNVTWCAAGCNSVNAFFNPANGYMYDSATQLSGVNSDPYAYSSFTGDPSAWNCTDLLPFWLGLCELPCLNPGSTACSDCNALCNQWCAAPMFDGPVTFGITTADKIGPMMLAGVNNVDLAPVGSANAGITGGYEIVTVPFEPVLTAAVWSWAQDQPPVNGSPKAAKLVLSGGTGRFYSANPSEVHRFAKVSACGRFWSVTSGQGTFSAGSSTVAAEAPTSQFAVPANGLQMSRLIDAVESSGATDVWVNYVDLLGLNNWTANVVSQVGPFYVQLNAMPPGNGTSINPYPTVTDAVNAVDANGDCLTEILIAGGSYDEQLTIDKQVKLIRNGGPVVRIGD